MKLGRLKGLWERGGGRRAVLGSGPVDAVGIRPWWPSDEAALFLRSRDKVIPIVGSGLSRGAGLPAGEQLAAWLRALPEALAPPGLDFDFPDNCLEVGDLIVPERLPDAELQARLAKHLKLSNWDFHLTDALLAVVRVPSRFVVTFNYDHLLEEAARKQDFEPRTYTWKDLQPDDVWGAFDAPAGHLTVFHLHGSVCDPSSIVLTQSAYQQVLDRKSVEHFIASVVRLRTACFVGVGGNEPYLWAAFQEAYAAPRKHVLVTDERTGAALRPLVLPRTGILIETFPEGAWETLDGFLAELVDRPAAAVPERPAASGTSVTPDAGYVPNVLIVAEDEEKDATTASMISWGFGHSLDEGSITETQRTVVVGAPGSGKSSLLRRVGELVPPDEIPILVPLRSVPVLPASAAKQLERWASVGEGMRGNEAVGVVALNDRRFHFLLDGLDEVAARDREAVARSLVAVAAEYPQHRFTVTSRPITTLDVFDADWTRLRLVPGSDWQARFLADHGLTWSELAAKVPLLGDVRSLLELPFFLRNLVELLSEGSVGEETDLLGVVEALVTRALEREHPLLPLDEASTRAWLRRVATAMLVMGRTTFSLEELRRIELPSGNIVGSAEELIESLVQRTMLATAGDEYAFAHRIVADSLAAELLLEVGPAADLLDVIAPRVSPNVAGVRSDFLVASTLVCSRNQTWRSAIRERDPLAAARSTPGTAPVVERLEAAQTIWRQYVEWQVWIASWRGGPGLLDDGANLTRLLRDPALDDVVAEVRDGLAHTSPQVRVNALEVMTGVVGS